MSVTDNVATLEQMPDLRWKLKEYLEQNEVSAYSVAKETGLSLPSIYRLTNNHSRYIQFDTLISIMITIEKKTGKPVAVSDILEYSPDA